MVPALVLLFQSHYCSHDLSGYVSQLGYIADGWHGDQVGSWPTRYKSGKINPEQKSREDWALICVSRGQWNFNVLGFFFFFFLQGDLGGRYSRGE